ncbi:glycoside hydrolase family 172 protein [Lachnoclostridium sp. Marseille-P6806]|uniref:glycoside hydrolase family 172 protein n=1 Tax=Lachnoclostridium sp. Marseille-P6806 TaxID=2364793 RepID=UPI00103201E3|nr:glycoside hydrolase family 172 protein [Lachnoclostridium sp. Marseille-P6806]
MYDFHGSLSSLPLNKHMKSRSINAENRTGEKGRGGMEAGVLGPSRKGSPCLRDIPAGAEIVLGEMEGPGMINHIWVTVADRTTEADCFVLRDLVLKIFWEDEGDPSVEAPLGDFFCCGFGRECVVNSLPMVVVPSRGMNCYFQMPFKKKARVILENQHVNPIPAFFYQIDYSLRDDLPEDINYFHAQWRRERLTKKGVDYTIIDGVKGKGHYVGTYLALTTLERYWWGEGELKFYIDGDEQYPTICGTGTEDYFGGSWSFAKQVNGETVEQNYCTPYLGYPYYSRQDDAVHNLYHNNDTMPQRGFYRWHIQDPICFDENLRVTIQQIGVGYRGLFERQDDVASVAYWYQLLPHAKFKELPPSEERWPR